jgi:hypothetical protein
LMQRKKKGNTRRYPPSFYTLPKLQSAYQYIICMRHFDHTMDFSTTLQLESAYPSLQD